MNITTTVENIIALGEVNLSKVVKDSVAVIHIINIWCVISKIIQGLIRVDGFLISSYRIEDDLCHIRTYDYILWSSLLPVCVRIIEHSHAHTIKTQISQVHVLLCRITTTKVVNRMSSSSINRQREFHSLGLWIISHYTISRTFYLDFVCVYAETGCIIHAIYDNRILIRTDTCLKLNLNGSSLLASTHTEILCEWLPVFQCDILSSSDGHAFSIQESIIGIQLKVGRTLQIGSSYSFVITLQVLNTLIRVCLTLHRVIHLAFAYGLQGNSCTLDCYLVGYTHLANRYDYANLWSIVIQIQWYGSHQRGLS